MEWAEQAEQTHGVYVQMNAPLKMEWRRERANKIRQARAGTQRDGLSIDFAQAWANPSRHRG